jgi:hypothetical protein
MIKPVNKEIRLLNPLNFDLYRCFLEEKTHQCTRVLVSTCRVLLYFRTKKKKTIGDHDSRHKVAGLLSSELRLGLRLFFAACAGFVND